VPRVNRVEIAGWMSEFLDGELLGDGCISTRTPGISGYYQHGSKYPEYLGWLSNVLASGGIEQTGCITSHRTQWGMAYKYASRSYRDLASWRERWYPYGKKIVPDDLELTALACRQWYIGDGHLQKSEVQRPIIVLYPQAFSDKGIERLRGRLGKLGFRVSRWSNNRLAVLADSVSGFLNWIGPCPAGIRDIYGYKWALN